MPDFSHWFSQWYQETYQSQGLRTNAIAGRCAYCGRDPIPARVGSDLRLRNDPVGRQVVLEEPPEEDAARLLHVDENEVLRDQHPLEIMANSAPNPASDVPGIRFRPVSSDTQKLIEEGARGFSTKFPHCGS